MPVYHIRKKSKNNINDGIMRNISNVYLVFFISFIEYLVSFFNYKFFFNGFFFYRILLNVQIKEKRTWTWVYEHVIFKYLNFKTKNEKKN